MSEIQDEAYSEAMAEIERWKVQHEEMLLKHAREQHAALSTLDEGMKEIERLRAEVNRMTEQAMHFRDMAERQGYLLTRAADALNNDHWCSSRELYGADAVGTCERCILIVELRKAAE